MPELCRFYGISIRLNFRDHNPPHFHALYGEHEAVIEINSVVDQRGGGAASLPWPSRRPGYPKSFALPRRRGHNASAHGSPLSWYPSAYGRLKARCPSPWALGWLKTRRAVRTLKSQTAAKAAARYPSSTKQTNERLSPGYERGLRADEGESEPGRHRRSEHPG